MPCRIRSSPQAATPMPAATARSERTSGWIPPLVRSLLAVAAGIGVAAWGEDRIRHGMRRYGAAMIGAGGGLVYLGLWAAAGPYALLDRRAGVLLLAASSVAVTL